MILFSWLLFLIGLTLKYSASLNYSEYYCNKRNNKQNVYDATCTVGKESDGPGDNQDYRDDVK